MTDQSDNPETPEDSPAESFARRPDPNAWVEDSHGSNTARLEERNRRERENPTNADTVPDEYKNLMRIDGPYEERKGFADALGEELPREEVEAHETDDPLFVEPAEEPETAPQPVDEEEVRATFEGAAAESLPERDDEAEDEDEPEADEADDDAEPEADEEHEEERKRFLP